MKLLDKLEKKFGKFEIEHIYLHIIGAQIVVYILFVLGKVKMEQLNFNATLLMKGEVWRIVSFIIAPTFDTPLSMLFSCIIFFIFCRSIETVWGAFKLNVYLLLGYLLTLTAAIIFPDIQVTNSYWLGAIIFPFAMLAPDFELLLFFILPVKVKYIAWVTAFVYLLGFIYSSVPGKLVILASVAPFFIFFWDEIIMIAKAHNRMKTAKTNLKPVKAKKAKPFHECEFCGCNDIDSPKEEFRYCSKCGRGFCSEHINKHNCKI